MDTGNYYSRADSCVDGAVMDEQQFFILVGVLCMGFAASARERFFAVILLLLGFTAFVTTLFVG